MSLAEDAPNLIPRAQLALFITDNAGTPLEKIIQDFEAQQEFTTETIPAEVDAALAAAAAAQSTANNAASKLATAAFVTLGDESADLPQSRGIQAGTGIALTDGGAGNPLTVATQEQYAVLSADRTDATGAFVNATDLVAAVAANSLYLIEAILTFRSANVAVGMGLTFTLPAGATITGAYDHSLTTLTTQTAYNNAAGAISADPNAVPIINTNLPIRGRWIVKTAGTAGNAQLQFRTSAAATVVTLKADLSALIARKIG